MTVDAIVTFDQHKAPELAVAKEDSRYFARGVWLEKIADRAFLAATDGHMLTLVRANVDDEAPIHKVYPREAFAAARKHAVRGMAAKLLLNGDATVLAKEGRMVFPPVEFGSAPKIDSLIPKAASETKFTLDAELLAKCQKALGASDVTIEWHGEGSPMVIVPNYRGTKAQSDGSFALLMPVGK